MNWQLFLARGVDKNLRRLPAGDRRRIETALKQLSRDPYRSHVKRLKPGSTEYSMRVGSYRILFDVIPQYRLVSVAAIVRRSDTTYG